MTEPVHSLTASSGLWTLLVAVLGAIVGSFLNVVIYRLPRGLSISRPRWSFCPSCERSIRPLDNIPIVSWFILRGRCRHCGLPISPIYPTIECLTLLAFVTVWDAAFIGKAVPGVGQPAADWPIALAWIVLLAGLLATAVMDLESYTVDIRVCVFTMLTGVAARAIWMKEIPDAAAASRAGAMPAALCTLAVVAGCVWLVTAGITRLARRRPATDPPEDAEPTSEADGEAADQTTASTATPLGPRMAPVLALCLAAAVLLIWQMQAPADRLLEFHAGEGGNSLLGRAATTASVVSAAGQRGFLTCGLFLLLLLLASLAHREADRQIIEEIEAERASARTTALRELAGFLPAIVVVVVLFRLLSHAGAASAGWPEMTERFAFLGSAWPQIIGGMEAVAGMVLAAAVGWSARILGTLAFGKEAYGTGDIYLMAGIGAVAGPWVVIFSFFLAAVLALFGVLVLLFRKSSRAIPFGPWLALGTLVTLWAQTSLMELFTPAAALLWDLLCRPGI